MTAGDVRLAPSAVYAGARHRVRELLADRAGAGDVAVPATPGWTVHDVVAHLTGVAEDVAAGRVASQGPTPEWTQGHVERGRGLDVPALLDRWDAAAPQVEARIDEGPVWPPVLDAGAHEHDLRGALGDVGARESDVVVLGAKLLLSGLRVPAPLVVRTEHHEVRARLADGADPAAAVTTLRTTTFEVFRWRLGRRSVAQLAAMDWDGDPTPFLPVLCLFGPAERDLVE